MPQSYHKEWITPLYRKLREVYIHSNANFAKRNNPSREQILAIKAERLECFAKSYDFEVGKLRDNLASGYTSKFIYPIPGKILAYSENSYEIYDEVAHTQSISS